MNQTVRPETMQSCAAVIPEMEWNEVRMPRRIKAGVEFFAGDDTEENPCGAARDLPT